jgi:hypothetical protein
VIGAADRRILPGPAGAIEVVLDWPAAPARADAPGDAAAAGLAVIGHPHPLYGGTLDNKVAVTLARTFAAIGWVAVRPNFRGVGASAGTHDDGRGETDDLLWLIDALAALPDVAAALAAGAEVVPAVVPEGAAQSGPADGSTRVPLPPVAGAPALALAGFSFGSFVVARAAERLAAAQRPAQHLVLVGAAAGKWPMPAVPADAIVIHGERDDTIALADVLRWAAPLGLPVIVIPDADHFFHRRLGVLRALVARNLLGSQRMLSGRAHTLGGAVAGIK